MSTSLLEEAGQPQNGEGHLSKTIKHEHDEGEEDHAEVQLALPHRVGVQLGAQEQRGRHHRHEHGQEEAEDVQEGVPLHQHKLTLHAYRGLAENSGDNNGQHCLLHDAKPRDARPNRRFSRITRVHAGEHLRADAREGGGGGERGKRGVGAS